MGRENLFRMSADHYEELGRSSIAHMFAGDEEGRRAQSRRQAMFLSGVLGGPPLYVQLVGSPRMRARHLPFVIDEAAREEWLRCYRVILRHPERYDFPADRVDDFLDFLERFSAWMVNRKSDEDGDPFQSAPGS